MAKFTKSNLPKVITKANKDISSIIESDLAKESNLLKKLVDHVAKSNKKLAKDRDRRMEDTKAQINEFDQHIEKLNQEISEIDHETLIRQLNQMLQTKEGVFTAKQSLRFYEAQKLPKTIGLLKEQTKQIQNDLINTQENLLTQSSSFTSSADEFFSYMHNSAANINQSLSDEFKDKAEKVKQEAIDLEELKNKLFKDETFIEELRTDLFETLDEQSLINDLTLYTNHSSEELSNKIQSEYNDKKNAITSQLEKIKDTYQKEQKNIKDEYFSFEQRMQDELTSEHEDRIQKEVTDREDTKEKLKNIKFAMMDAEKEQNYRKVKSLIREYQKTEEKLKNSEESKVQDKVDSLTQKEHESTLQKLYDLEVTYIKEKNEKELELALLNINHEKDKHNYLLQTDYNELVDGQEDFLQLMNMLMTFYDQYKDAKIDIIEQRKAIRLAELDILKGHETSKITFIHAMDELIETLEKQINDYVSEIVSLEQQKYENMVDAIFEIKQSLLKIDLEKQLITIDHRIINRENERLIQTEKEKDDKEQKIIILESQIEVALKEKELQLIKVKSLYEYEKRLAEEQVSRISGGIEINDAFVKTTLENQLLFAEQQIEYAKGEYEIRLESIELTREQEITYASQKLEEYRHNFDQEIEKLEKFRNDKLEDLEYKMMLFTSTNDHRKFQKQIDELNQEIDQKIDEINEQIETNEQITRYQEMIDKANVRFERAKEDARVLKEQTISSFQSLYDKTKAKHDDMEETSHSEESKNLTPVLNNQALSKAHERLEHATKEAEVFYQERIKEPTALIEEYRAEADALAEDNQDDEFIQKQKLLKEEIKSEFSENENKIRSIASEEKQEFTTSFAALKIPSFDHAKYLRNTDDINKNYTQLTHQENKRSQLHIQQINDKVDEEQKLINRISKQYKSEISKLIKRYKAYLKVASKGIKKQERELKSEASKQLKHSLKDAKKNLELKQ